MTPETEVIACPACKHLLRVPLDWLGTQVQCPECKAPFRAPVRIDGALTEPELMPQPWATAAPAVHARKYDVMLLIPAFGLLLCGVAGTVVNGVLLYLLLTDPAWGKGWAKQQLEAKRKVFGGGEDGAGNDAEEERLLGYFRWILPLALAASAVVLAGGLSIALRWNYRLAKLGCVVAFLNFPHGCCIPGAAFGLWGFLLLSSDEGREHFLK
jgi:hypothetical protein